MGIWVLNDVFVAGLPGLVPVHQQQSVVMFSSVRIASLVCPAAVPSVSDSCFLNLFQ